MAKATTLKEAAVAVVKYSTEVTKNLRQERDWLWLTGDYKDDPDTRAVLKETGFRFSRNGHALVDKEGEETGEVAHWYFAAGFKPRGRGARRRVKAKRAAAAATRPTPTTPTADLLPSDNVDEEFEAMFGTT